MSATHAFDPTTPRGPVLYLAFELGWNSWAETGVASGPKPVSLHDVRGVNLRFPR
jgi:hypothetical protein